MTIPADCRDNPFGPNDTGRIVAFRVALAVLVVFAASLLLSALGCASVPESRPAGTTAEGQPFAESRPSIQLGFCAWADAKGRELERRFGIPAPESMLRETPAPQTGSIEVGGYEVLAVYTIGRYHRETGLIELWSLDWDGKPFSDEAIRHTWLHEWLHHYDRVLGLPPATGPHNDDFDRRITEMNL